MGGLKQIVKNKPILMDLIYRIARFGVSIFSVFCPVNEESMMFVSLSGRNYDDSPKALYEYIKERPEFKDWTFYWGLIDSSHIRIPEAKIIRFGTVKYWRTLLSSRVWIGNGGIDKGINFVRKQNLVVNTWHGTPMKKIEGEENSNQVLSRYRSSRPIDYHTIRCCQSEFDKEIFARVFRADKNSFIMSGLPRNDGLLKYSEVDIKRIKLKLGLTKKRKVILYVPTYREYLINSKKENFLKPPIDLRKWENELGEDYYLLIRAHYAVSASLGIQDNDFVRDVSSYSPLNDLYAVTDILISDYSSCFFDFSLLGRPMRCFAYDLERYENERGFYFNPEDYLPCPIHQKEEELIDSIVNIDVELDSKKTKEFAKLFIPNEGHACEAVTEKLLERLAMSKMEKNLDDNCRD